jgi:transposase
LSKTIKLKEIYKIAGRSISTICSFLKRQEESGSIENKGRSGRPCIGKCNVQRERQLVRLVKNNHRRILTEITNVNNENGRSSVSESTVKRILNRMGYQRRLVKKNLRIREVNKVE